MIKKLSISAVLLAMFVLTSTPANAALFDWASDHPLVNDASNWSMGSVYGDVFKLNTIQEQQSGATPVPIPIAATIQKPKPVKVDPIATYVVMATAYSSTPDQTDSTPFVTAWGTKVRDGIVAANFLPLGTTIKIPELYGDKIFVVEDRMNKRYTYKIDIWFPERELAKIFGVKRVKLVVVAKI